MNSNYRNPSKSELEIILKLLSVSFPGSEELRSQVTGMKVRNTKDSDNYGSVEIKTLNSNFIYDTKRIPVEGLLSDTDGIAIRILLHVFEGKLHELEFYKVDGSSMYIKPDIKRLELITDDSNELLSLD